MNSEIKELVEKVKLFALQDGYEICDVVLSDFWRTVKLKLTRDGQEYSIPIIEQFYDTDEDGEITKYHGQLDIRDTVWFNDKLAKESRHGR